MLGASSFPRGDVNCSGVTDGRDALDTLLVLAGEAVALPEECAPVGQQTVLGLGGDVNCDGEFDLLDPLIGLKLVSGLSVNPCLDVTLSEFGGVNKEFGPAGGALNATGLDGTEFTLEIPEGALLAPEMITMTPIESIDNLPVAGGLVAAVDIQPSGLLFWDAALLTIDPATPVEPGDQTPFVINVGDFVLQPLLVESEEVQVPLSHLSTAGLAQGPVNNPPTLSSALNRYTAEVAALVLPQRVAVLGGGSGDPMFDPKLAALSEAYYDAEIAPGLDASDAAQPAGLGACPVEISVVATALGLNGPVGQFPQLQNALQVLSPYLAGCRQGDFERCVQFDDLRAIGRIVAYTRVMAVLGIDSSPSPMEDMIQKCARFEVDFHSRFCVDNTSALCSCPAEGCPNGSIDYAFSTPYNTGYVTLTLTPSQGPLVSIPLNKIRGAWGPYQGCSGTMTSPGSTFKVLSGGVSMNTFLAGANLSVTLVINPGIPLETLTLSCFGPEPQLTTLWWQKWCSWHQPELTRPHPDTGALCFSNDEPNGWNFVIRNWRWQNGRPAITKYLFRDNDDVGALEIGWEEFEMHLVHAPLP